MDAGKRGVGGAVQVDAAVGVICYVVAAGKGIVIAAEPYAVSGIVGGVAAYQVMVTR